MEKIIEDVADNVKSIDVKDKKKKVVLAVPGKWFSSKFLVSWTSTLNAIWESAKYDIVISPGVSSYVTFARMQTLGLSNLRGIDQKPFDGIDFDIWLTIDSDIIFTPQNLIDLLDATEHHSVVSGIYRMSDLKHFATVRNWDVDYFRKQGNFNYLRQEDVDEWSKANSNEKFMKVVYTGMGFMACTKEALYDMSYPYFHSELQEFRGTDGKLIRDMCSEDVAFCKNLEKAGHGVHIIPSLRVGHEKDLVI